MRNPNPDDIDITSVFGQVRRGLPKLAITSLVLGGLTFAVLSMIAPRFTSEAEVKVTAKSKPNILVDPDKDTGNADAVRARLDKEAVNTHVRAMKSRDLAKKIAAKFNLAENREFNSALGANDALGGLLRMVGIGGPDDRQTTQDRVLEAYFNRLKVYTPKESRIIASRFSSSDPQLAADIANAIVGSYQSQLAVQDSSDAEAVLETLKPKIANLRAELVDAESKVRALRVKTDTTGRGDQRTTAIEQQMAELTQELSRVRGQRSEAEVRAKSARELAGSGSAAANADVLRSPLIQTLSDQRVGLEREKSQLSITLLPGHPNMRRVNAELAGLKRQLKGEIAKVVDSLEKEARIAKLREQSIKSDLAKIKSRNVDTTSDQVELRDLEAIAKSKQGELERLLAQFEIARGAVKDVVSVETQIVTKASAASVPVFPKKGSLTGLVTLATFLLGLAWIVTKALMKGARGGSISRGMPPSGGHDRYDGGEADVKVVRHPAAAVSANPSDDGPVLPGSINVGPPAVDQTVKVGNVAALTSYIQTAAPGTGGFRTLLAGESNALDAGSEAVDLATSLSATGANVIILDWSLDGTGVVQKIGLPVSPGITDLLTGSATFEQTIKQVPGGNLHVISCGAGISDGSSELDPDQLNLVLDALDEAYDHIVVVGRYDSARDLFETIEGRFDAGVIVGEEKRRVSVIQDPPGTFLGFEVADIALVRFERDGAEANPAQRIVRVGVPKVDTELRPS